MKVKNMFYIDRLAEIIESGMNLIIILETLIKKFIETDVTLFILLLLSGCDTCQWVSNGAEN